MYMLHVHVPVHVVHGVHVHVPPHRLYHLYLYLSASFRTWSDLLVRNRMRYSLTEQSVTSMCQCGRIASVIFREWRLQDHTVFSCVKRTST